MASRNLKPEIRVFSVKFSPTGQAWAAATTEGLLIYSLNKSMFWIKFNNLFKLYDDFLFIFIYLIFVYIFTGIVFDPFNLSLEVTPKSIRESLNQHEYSSALIMALKLNEINLIQEIIEKIPYNESK